ncbi:MAG: hypothetical protein ACM31C_07135 [Acidobacteriota bacterium]
MKVAHAIRAAMLAIALFVIVAPIPYFARELPGGGRGHHQHLTFLEAVDEAPYERAVLVWWGACAAVLAWAELARRSGRGVAVGRAVRWVVVIAASLLVFARSALGSLDHIDRLEGAGLFDLSALVYLLAMIAGTVAALAEPERS